MAESGQPRTLLEALVRQRQLTWDEAADLVMRTARQHEAISISLSGRHLGRLARNERSGNRPNPATRRALQYAFDRPVDELLGPCTPGDIAGVGGSERGGEASEALTVAADRARRFMTSLQTLSDESLQLVHDEVQDLVRAYPVRPLPEILSHLVSGQETVFSLLERPQRPTHARQLYFLSAVLGGLLAKASHDLADPHTGLAQSRTAWLCAEQADHDGLRAWISGLRLRTTPVRPSRRTPITLIRTGALPVPQGLAPSSPSRESGGEKSTALSMYSPRCSICPPNSESTVLCNHLTKYIAHSTTCSAVPPPASFRNASRVSSRLPRA